MFTKKRRPRIRQVELVFSTNFSTRCTLKHCTIIKRVKKSNNVTIKTIITYKE